MTDVKGYMGSVSFDGQTITLKKKMRGSTRIPLDSVAAVTIEPAGVGMKAIRFSVAGGSQAGKQRTLGNHKDSAQDPNALTFMVGSTGRFEALIAEIEAARHQNRAWAQPQQAGQQQAASWPVPASTAAQPVPQPQPTWDAPQPVPSQTDELVRLAELHRSGVLTDAEFGAAKSRLLGL